LRNLLIYDRILSCVSVQRQRGMRMESSTCETRTKLLEVLEAHPALVSVPKSKILSNGRKITTTLNHGHVVSYYWGEGKMVIHRTNGHISIVAEEGSKSLEAVSRKGGQLQGIDSLPAWVDARLRELTEIPTHFN
jgi:hypothetical protein